MPWRLLQPKDLLVVREWAGETLPPASQRRLLSAVSAAVRSDQLKAADQDEVGHGNTVRLRPRSRRIGPGAAISSRAVKLLLENVRADESLAGRRDAALLSLLLLAGLRRCELVGLALADFEEDDGSLTVRSRRELRRSILLNGSCRVDLERWLAARGSGTGPLFLRIHSAGGLSANGLSASAVNLILERRCAAAGAAGIRPSDLRQRFLRQLQSRAGNPAEARACRFYMDSLGQSGWALPSLPDV